MRLSTYIKVLNQYGDSAGVVRKTMSDDTIEQTWDEDIQSRVCYIYTYDSDDESQKHKYKHITYDNTNKTKVDAKFIITQYGTLSKDQVEYHIMFKPSYTEPFWYSDIEEKYGAEFPIGLYIDIPDDRGIYRKWLVCSKEISNQFVKYSVLPCNYLFSWMNKENKPIQMWGVARLRNSYNSGIWAEYVFSTVENQDQMWIPMNDESRLLFYDDRIIVSANIPEPICWKITKVENFHPLGVCKLTLGQTKYEPDKDYYDEKTKSWFAGGCSYFKNEQIILPGIKGKSIIEFSSKSMTIKVGGGDRKAYATFYDENDTEISINNVLWNLSVNGTDANQYMDIAINSDQSIDIKIDEMSFGIIGETLKIEVSDSNGNYYSAIFVDIVGI